MSNIAFLDQKLPMDVDSLYRIAKDNTSINTKAETSKTIDEDADLLEGFVVINNEVNPEQTQAVNNKTNDVNAEDADILKGFVVIDNEVNLEQIQAVANKIDAINNITEDESKKLSAIEKDFTIIDIKDDTPIVKQLDYHLNIIEEHQASRLQKAAQLIASLNRPKPKQIFKIVAPVIGGIALGLLSSPLLMGAALTISSGLVSALKQKDNKAEAAIGAGALTAGLQLMANIVFTPLFALPLQVICSAIGVYSLSNAKDMLKTEVSDSLRTAASNWLDSVSNLRVFSKKPLYFLKDKFSGLIDSYFADIENNMIPELEQSFQDKFFSIIENIGSEILKICGLKKDVYISTEKGLNKTKIFENYQDDNMNLELGLCQNNKAVSWKEFVQNQRNSSAAISV